MISFLFENLSCELHQLNKFDRLIIKSKHTSVTVDFDKPVFPYDTYGKKIKWKVFKGQVKDEVMFHLFIGRVVSYIRNEYSSRRERSIDPKDLDLPML